MKLIPNHITGVRILLVPIIAACIFTKKHSCAIILFSVAIITDFLDGYLARTTNQITRVGMLLDPLADKLLVMVCLILLIWNGSINPILPCIILARDLIVTTFQHDLAPSQLAKFKTCILYLAIACLLSRHESLVVPGNVILAIGTTLSVITMFQSLTKYRKASFQTYSSII